LYGRRLCQHAQPKSSKECVIGFLTKKLFIGCVMVDHDGKEAINKENGGMESFIPKF